MERVIRILGCFAAVSMLLIGTAQAAQYALYWGSSYNVIATYDGSTNAYLNQTPTISTATDIKSYGSNITWSLGTGALYTWNVASQNPDQILFNGVAPNAGKIQPWAGGIAVDRGSTDHLWNYNTGSGWGPINIYSPDLMAPWGDLLTASFTDFSLYRYPSFVPVVDRLNEKNPVSITAWGNSRLAVSFSAADGGGIYYYEGTSNVPHQINLGTASLLAGWGDSRLAATFDGVAGLWVYSPTAIWSVQQIGDWYKINEITAEDVIGVGDKLVVDMGLDSGENWLGLWQYNPDLLGSGWSKITNIEVNPDKLLALDSTPQDPVPVPSALILLASGLIGLVGIRRRFGTSSAR